MLFNLTSVKLAPVASPLLNGERRMKEAARRFRGVEVHDVVIELAIAMLVFTAGVVVYEGIVRAPLHRWAKRIRPRWW